MFSSRTSNKFGTIFSELSKTIIDLNNKEGELFKDSQLKGEISLDAKKYLMVRELNMKMSQLINEYNEKKCENVTILRQDTLKLAEDLALLSEKYFSTQEYYDVLNTPRNKKNYALSLFAHAGLTTSAFALSGITIPTCFLGTMVFTSAIYKLIIKTRTMHYIFRIGNQAQAMKVLLKDGLEYSTVTESYYDILGITPLASINEIDHAYKKLSLTYHPDRSSLPKELATARFQKIVEAHTALRKPELRKAYDHWYKYFQQINQYFLETPQYSQVSQTAVDPEYRLAL